MSSSVVRRRRHRRRRRPSVPIEFPRKYISYIAAINECCVESTYGTIIFILVLVVQIVHTKKPRLTSKQNMAQIYVGTVIEFPRKVIR